MIRALLAAAVLVLMPLSARASPAAEEVFARRTTPVAPHVWLVFKPNPADPPFEGNVTVIEQAEGLVVIDAGGSPVSGRNVVAEIRKLSRKPVKWLVYTHYHGDHNLGAGAFREAWPKVRIVSSAKTRENMTGPPMAYVQTYAKSYGDMAAYAQQQSRNEALPQGLRDGWARTAAAGPGMVAGYSGMQIWPADLTITDHMSLPDRTAPVELRFLGRANTDGDLIAWLPKQKVLVTGDIVVAPIPYAAHTYPGEWLTVLKQLRGYGFKVLIPGHGAPQADRVYMDKLILTLEDVRAQVAPLKDLPLDEVRKKVVLKPIVDRFAGDDPWLRNLMGAVFLSDLVSNAWKEARGEAVVQGKG